MGRSSHSMNPGALSFNALQNYGSNRQPVLSYAFAVLMLSGRELMRNPLERRRQILEEEILPTLVEPVRYIPFLNARLSDVIQSVKSQGREGIVAKRADSFYEPGLRSGAWQKMRVNLSQEFVLGDIPSATPLTRLWSAITTERICCTRLGHAMGLRRLPGNVVPEIQRA